MVSGPDVFISKLDASGNFVWAKHIGGGDVVSATALALDKAANVFVLVYYGGTVDFDPGAGVYDMTTDPIADTYGVAMSVLKLDKDCNFYIFEKVWWWV